MGRYKLPYSLFKRGKYWYYRTYTVDGVRTVPKSTGCRTKGEAVRFCEALYINGAMSDSDISFYKYAHNFFNDDSIYLRDRGTPLAFNTIKVHRSRYNSTIEPYFKDFKIKDINAIELKKFRTKLLEEGLKISTINMYFSTLKLIIDSAYKEDLITRNPFDKLDALDNDDDGDTRPPYTLEQIKQVYNEIDAQYKNLVLILALTGMRLGEAVGVTQKDIKQTDKTIYIDLNKQKLSTGDYARLKTKLKRNIPIIEEIKNIIDINTTDYSTAYKNIKNVSKKLFGDDTALSPHSFRHFFVTSTKAANINPVKVKRVSGHKLDNKVEDTYTNFTADDLIDVLPWQKDKYNFICGRCPLD